MNWRTFSAILGVLLIFQTCQRINDKPTTMAQVPPPPHAKHDKKPKGEKVEKLLQQIDLTTEQRQKIAAIQEESNTKTEALEALHQEMHSQHQKMESLLVSNASIEQLRQQHQQLEKLHQQLGNNRFETMLRIREVLTSEQRAKIAELMEQHRGERFDR